MYLLILFLPILNFIITILFGRLIGRYYIFIYNIIFSFLVVIISYFAFYEVILLNNECYVNVYNWINISFLNVNCIFLYDSLTCVMLMLVSTISFLVHLLFNWIYVWWSTCYTFFILFIFIYIFYVIIS